MSTAKPRPTLLPARAVLDAALLMAEQQDDHGDRWRERTAQHHADAAGRHLLEHAAGVRTDEDSGHSPLIHAALRCLMAWEREQAARAASPSAALTKGLAALARSAPTAREASVRLRATGHAVGRARPAPAPQPDDDHDIDEPGGGA